MQRNSPKGLGAKTRISEKGVRKACLESLSNKMVTSSGIEITDVTRLFHGAGPQQKFERGEQKGGNAGCSGCSGDARR